MHLDSVVKLVIYILSLLLIVRLADILLVKVVL